VLEVLAVPVPFHLQGHQLAGYQQISSKARAKLVLFEILNPHCRDVEHHLLCCLSAGGRKARKW